MVVSFRVSKTGNRYRPKPVIRPEAGIDEVQGNSNESNGFGSKDDPSCKMLEGHSMAGGGSIAEISSSLLSEHESSFTLKLYADGYSIGKPSEEGIPQTGSQDAPKLLLPYDRTSETFFSAIESGHIPVDFLDDIPCKFIDGMLICEVHDYRKCALEHVAGTSPVVNRVCLRMSLENVVKDIPLITDNSWTYGDMMEIEARILEALQPQLFLDPTPRLDRLCSNPVPTKLNLGLNNLRRKRSSEMRRPEVTVTTSNRTHGKKVCIDRVMDTSNSRSGDTGFMSGNLIGQHVQENLASQNLGSSNVFGPVGVGTQRTMQEQVSGSNVNVSGASSAAQDVFISHNDSVNSGPSLHGKRETSDGRTPLSTLNKKARLTSPPSDGMQQRGQPMDSLHVPEMNRRNPVFQQPAMARGTPYSNAGMLLNPNSGQSSFPAGMRFGPKEEQFNQEKLNKELYQMGHFDPQQRVQQNVMRPNITQAAWNNHHNQELRKEEQLRKRKSEQNPRLSIGPLAQPPLSSKSGEFSSGSGGPHFGAVAAASARGSSQKEKSVVNSGPTGGALPSSAGDLQRQPPHQALKRRSNSLPKNPAMNAVSSPVSVSNVSIPFNASSSPVGTPNMADQATIERFTKIEMVTMRHQLISRKKHKVEDNPVRKSNAYSSHNLVACLSAASNEDFNDDSSATKLSKSLVGGSINVYKMRVINFMQADQVLQGNVVSSATRIKTRMVMSEKQSDGTIAMHYGEVEDGDVLSAEDYLPSLPNAHYADLLAAQFCSLMIREGYIVEDRIQPKPVHAGLPNQLSASGVLPNSSALEIQQFGEAVASQHSIEARPTLGGNASSSPYNQLVSTRMLPPGSSQPSHMPQSPQQLEQPLQQQPPLQRPHALSQQQHPQFQRPPMVLPSNLLPHSNVLGQMSNMQLGGHMVNKASPLQMQPLQQQQQQQPSMQQRKMMMGLGQAMGLGNLPNNIVGLGGLGNAMSMGGMGGIGGPGISGPMTPTGLNNSGQNPMNLGQSLNINAISQLIRSGQLTQQQAAIITSRLRMEAQNRTSMLVGNQSGLAGMQAGRQVHPGSAGLNMLGQSLNRANMNPMQRSAMGPMGPPKLGSGVNMYTNQQLQQQQQQQHLQQQQQLQLQQQQQEATSSMQGVVSPSQVGSPSAGGITQPGQPSQQPQPLQQPSPQQMSQRTPMSPQLSSGVVHAMSASNPDACPASPQLSSQTLGSVGSITNSPMDLQGVNKGNSAS